MHTEAVPELPPQVRREGARPGLEEDERGVIGLGVALEHVYHAGVESAEGFAVLEVQKNGAEEGDGGFACV